MSQKFKTYLLNKPESKEDYPFGPEAAIFKVRNKMFASYAERDGGVFHLNLKCEPEEALALRDVFEAVIPGFHMNKKHWNTVILDDSIPDGEIERMIDRSYGLVVKGMPKAERQSLELKYGEHEIYK